MRTPFPYSRSTALVTGASSGIGAAFADQLAARGANLVVVARNAPALEDLATRLRCAHGVEVRVAPGDLGDAVVRLDLLESLADTAVDLLVNNAGFGTHGSFVQLPWEREIGQVELNCAAVVHLSRALLPAMVARGDGGIINVASTAAFAPCPNMATYGATKAFVLSFSEAVAIECRGSGVRILALCPGAVDTGFGAATGDSTFGASGFFARATGPEDVVGVALAALDQGRTSVVFGIYNRVMALGTRLVPRSWSARISGRILA
ncbi:MAG: SDR family oxidoreductase [Actinomycetota bacterium]|nr:SDR family oxidoreductase [Actinomycetota bacterium]